MHILCWTAPLICQRTAEQQSFHAHDPVFLRVTFAILRASVILEGNETHLERNEKCLERNETRLERNEKLLERNETRLERNETRLERNETRLARNEVRGGNLILSGTICSEWVMTFDS